MNFCPSCGLDLRKIQEAIDREKEIWRPIEFELDTWTDYDGSTATYEPPMPYIIVTND